MKRFLLLSIVVMIIGALVLSGCGGTTSAPSTTSAPPATSTAPAAAPAKTLTIGNINSLTGMFSDFEKFDPEGAQIAVDYVNSQGGLTIGGQKYNVELYILDGKASSEGVTQAANAMIYDKNIKFICGEGVTPLAIAVDAVTEQAGAIFSARFSNSSPNKMGAKFPLKFVGGNCYFSCMKAILAYLHKTYPAIKNFAFEAIDDGTLKTATPVINQFAGESGLQMAGDVVGFDFSVTDMTPIVQKVMTLNPQAVMRGAMTQTSQALSIKQLRALGYKGPLFACTPGNLYEAVEVVGKDAFEGFFAIGFPSDAASVSGLPQVTQDLVKIGMQKSGMFSMTQWQGADGAFSLLMAIQSAQSLDPKVVAQKWENMTLINTTFGPGTLGGLKTYGANHNVYHATPIQAYVNGQIKLQGIVPVENSVIP